MASLPPTPERGVGGQRPHAAPPHPPAPRGAPALAHPHCVAAAAGAGGVGRGRSLLRFPPAAPHAAPRPPVLPAVRVPGPSEPHRCHPRGPALHGQVLAGGAGGTSDRQLGSYQRSRNMGSSPSHQCFAGRSSTPSREQRFLLLSPPRTGLARLACGSLAGTQCWVGPSCHGAGLLPTRCSSASTGYRCWRPSANTGQAPSAWRCTCRTRRLSSSCATPRPRRC